VKFGSIGIANTAAFSICHAPLSALALEPKSNAVMRPIYKAERNDMIMTPKVPSSVVNVATTSDEMVAINPKTI
jgi:hypothetical protein